METITTADDFSDADGVAILDFRQAQALARERMVQRARNAAGKRGPWTVADAMNAYLDFSSPKSHVQPQFYSSRSSSPMTWSGASPVKARRQFSTARRSAMSCASPPCPELCGEAMTFGRSQSPPASMRVRMN